jgi:hypothetical protein
MNFLKTGLTSNCCLKAWWLKKTLISTTIIVSDWLGGLCSSAAYQNQGNQHVSQHGDNGYKRLVQIVTQLWLPFPYWDLGGEYEYKF